MIAKAINRWVEFRNFSCSKKIGKFSYIPTMHKKKCHFNVSVSFQTWNTNRHCYSTKIQNVTIHQSIWFLIFKLVQKKRRLVSTRQQILHVKGTSQCKEPHYSVLAQSAACFISKLFHSTNYNFLYEQNGREKTLLCSKMKNSKSSAPLLKIIQANHGNWNSSDRIQSTINSIIAK